jgi:amino acid transporter
MSSSAPSIYKEDSVSQHTGGAGSTATAQSADQTRLESLGYKQELSRVLSLFENFGVAFCYLSPVVGVFSLFVLGVGSAGPAYIWLMPVVIVGQLFVALVFAELGSHYPIAGALFHWGKNLLGAGYGWWVGWIYGWALIITVASVDTGIPGYIAPLFHSLFGTNWDPTAHGTILLITLVLLAIQTIFNVLGVRLLGLISRYGVYVEILGTFGIAILLAIEGFHHGLGFLFSTHGAANLKSNPLGVGFNGHWLLGAALVAILAHVYIFYGFESAGDVAEEVVDASRHVPKAIVRSLLVGGVASFILVAALILAMPSTGAGYASAASFTGGVPFIITNAVHSNVIYDVVLALVCFAFFSCGTAVQGAGARLAFSYARDKAIPGSSVIRRISPKRHTPVVAILVAAVIPALFMFLVYATPSKNIHIWFVTYPANVNALTALVSFGVSGIYLSFMLVLLGALIARLRGWKPDGHFTLGRWGYPVTILGLIYGTAMLVNIVIPTGITSPKGELFNFDWMTLVVVVFIVLIGAIYYFTAHPQRRSATETTEVTA